jgi:hypothetical protein
VSGYICQTQNAENGKHISANEVWEWRGKKTNQMASGKRKVERYGEKEEKRKKERAQTEEERIKLMV